MNEHSELDTKVAVIIQHPAGSDAYEQAEEIISLVRADERKRIREALLSDEAAQRYTDSLVMFGYINPENRRTITSDGARKSAIAWAHVLGLTGQGGAE